METMRIAEFRGDEDAPILGLVSEPASSRATVVHVHGYGGDMLSNYFVRQSHEYWPSREITFVSLRLPTSSYIEERYSDAGVTYVGSSLTLPSAAVRTVLRVLEELHSTGATVVLQGHSFGTNVVKRVVSASPLPVPAIYLSPADSRWLQAEYASQNVDLARAHGAGEIVWDVFGIAVAGRRYSIPIAADLAKPLFDSAEFNAWTTLDDWRSDARALVVQALGDPISAAGDFGPRLRRSAPPNVLFKTVASTSHAFADAVPELLAGTTEWVDAAITPLNHTDAEGK